MTARAADGTVLVVAKAPVPGLAKTRLAATIGAEAAADLAAACLLDTLEAARDSGAATLVALTGDLARAARRTEVEAALADVVVFGQRGTGLGERLTNAHADAHGLVTGPVFQVGMDTPQITGALLVQALAAAERHRAVLGLATDGGWWGLSVATPRLAQVLLGVAMSTNQTGSGTRAALEAAGAVVHPLAVLRDVDAWNDARAVAELAPSGRFGVGVDRVAAAIRSASGSEAVT